MTAKKYVLIYGGAFWVLFAIIFVLNEFLVELPIEINSLVLAFLVAGGFLCFVAVQHMNKKNFRSNIEHGSSRWGTKKEASKYEDKNPNNNVALTKQYSMTISNRVKVLKNARNKNILIIGGSGSGKTFSFIKPNLMQCDSKDYPVSFVVTDPKGVKKFYHSPSSANC